MLSSRTTRWNWEIPVRRAGEVGVLAGISALDGEYQDGRIRLAGRVVERLRSLPLPQRRATRLLDSDLALGGRDPANFVVGAGREDRAGRVGHLEDVFPTRLVAEPRGREPAGRQPSAHLTPGGVIRQCRSSAPGWNYYGERASPILRGAITDARRPSSNRLRHSQSTLLRDRWQLRREWTLSQALKPP